MDHDEGRRASRRRLLTGLGSIGLTALLPGCTEDTTAPPAPPPTPAPAPPATTTSSLALLFQGATTCTLTATTPQGPYYFDAGKIRSDIREDRPGTRLRLALKLQDSESCTPLPGATVEIWHCDAAGVYSGAQARSSAAPPAPTAARPFTAVPRPSATRSRAGSASPPASPAPTADLTPVDDQRYLRGAQLTDTDGIVQFVTIWPGWHPGRTVHLNVMVRVNETRVLTTQLMFDEKLNDRVHAAAPYDTRPGRDTTNAIDPVFDDGMLLKISQEGDGWLGLIVLAADSDKDNA